jgi:diadenylate cyclase
MNWLADSWLLRDYVLPALDMLLLAFLIYRTYRILVQTRAVQLIKGALFMGLVYLTAFLLRLATLRWVLNLLVPGLVIGMAIIFQPELRRIFTHLGQGTWLRFHSRVRTRHVEAVLNAAEVLAAKRYGALIVFTRNIGLNTIVETGTRLNAELSSSLLLTLFAPGTPLHDGAVVIHEDRVVAAGCFLPLSEQPDIRRSFGTRHRAALGLAEETDALILVVSEESGSLSLAHDANLLYDLSLEEISRRLKRLLELPSEDSEEGRLEA